MPTKPERHLCNHCGKAKVDTVYRHDPYLADIEGIEVMMWLCDECYDVLCDEI